MRWLAHLLGLDNGSGPWYLFWSGVVGDFGLVSIAWGQFRKHNCHQRWCWRVGHRSTDAGDVVCRRHHPDGHLTAELVHRRHHEAEKWNRAHHAARP